jgi:hypothetical protein
LAAESQRRARHGAELDAATLAAALARATGPSWSRPTRAPPGRAGAVRRAPPARAGAVHAGATVPSWSCPRAPRCRAGAVRRAHHRAELELSERAPRAPSWAQRWPLPWSKCSPSPVLTEGVHQTGHSEQIRFSFIGSLTVVAWGTTLVSSAPA